MSYINALKATFLPGRMESIVKKNGCYDSKALRLIDARNNVYDCLTLTASGLAALTICNICDCNDEIKELTQMITALFGVSAAAVTCICVSSFRGHMKQRYQLT